MISIVIATRGERPEELARCIKSIEENTKDFEIIVSDFEGGFNEKLNRGTEKAKGDYIAWLHDDNEVLPGWADVLADVGSFLVGEMNDSFDIWGGYYTPQAGYATNADTPPQYSAFMQVSRDALQKIGPFDEAYTEPGFQDIDFGLQVAKAGYTITPLPGKIIHRVSPIHRVLQNSNEQYLKEKWVL